jgi:RNA polymerase sigma factor (sigma-70 family)
VDAHGDRLFRYALSRIRDERAAEDLVQESLVTAFQSRDKFQGNSTELTWMIGILRNKIFEHLRRQSREVPLGRVMEKDGGDREEALFDASGHWKTDLAPADWGGEPQKKAESAEFAAALKDCLDALTPNVARACACAAASSAAFSRRGPRELPSRLPRHVAPALGSPGLGAGFGTARTPPSFDLRRLPPSPLPA